MSISGWPVDKENYGVYCMFSLALAEPCMGECF